MKWVIFGLGLVAVIPLAAWLRQKPDRVRKFWIVIGALPFVWGIFPRYQIAISGVPEWPGYVQGFNVSIIDLMLVAAFFGIPRSHSKIPFKFVFLLYICVVLLSALQAGNPTATFYYVWQLLRIFLAFLIIARACSDTGITVALLRGLAIGVCFEAAIVGWQRFVVHDVHASGAFVHPNILGMAINLVIFPFFALLLSGERDWQPTSIPLLGTLVDIFTTSRAAIGFAGVGFSLLFLLSAMKRWTPRKGRTLLIAFLAAIVLAPIAYRQFGYRFYSSVDSSGFFVAEGRAQLNKAAELILSDHPMGVGANNFVIAANVGGYYDRASVFGGNRHTFAHNAYWTTLAETGYIGLAALVILLLRPFLFAISWGWRSRGDRRADLLLGLATALLIFAIHSFFEWNFFKDQIQYIIAIDFGLIAGLAAQLGYRPLRAPNSRNSNDSSSFLRAGIRRAGNRSGEATQGTGV